MRILHIASLRSAEANRGVVQQMEWEQAAALDAGLPWTAELWTVSPKPTNSLILRQVPGWMGGVLLRRLHFHLRLRKAAKEYEQIVIRHAPLDPFCQLLPRWIRRRTWYVFHTKTEDYLRGRGGWLGPLFAWLDKLLTRNALRDAKGIIGVTNELVTHERERLRLPNLAGFVYPNGLYLSDWDADIADNRQGELKIIFIASRFYRWNGLEEILKSMADCKDAHSAQLHLVGDLLPSQREFITEMGLCDRVTIHGSLSAIEIRRLLAAMDISLGAFALHEVGARSACTLKVRESLGAGVPVCAGHHDVGLEGLPRCYRLVPPHWSEIVRAAGCGRLASKVEVRTAARPRIDKKGLVCALYSSLRAA